MWWQKTAGDSWRWMFGQPPLTYFFFILCKAKLLLIIIGTFFFAVFCIHFCCLFMLPNGRTEKVQNQVPKINCDRHQNDNASEHFDIIHCLFHAVFLAISSILVQFMPIYNSTAIEIRNNDLLQVDALLSNTFKPSLVYFISLNSIYTTKQHAEPDDIFIYGILLSSTVVHCSFSMPTICFRAKSSNFMLFRLGRFLNCFYFDFFFLFVAIHWNHSKAFSNKWIDPYFGFVKYIITTAAFIHITDSICSSDSEFVWFTPSQPWFWFPCFNLEQTSLMVRFQRFYSVLFAFSSFPPFKSVNAFVSFQYQYNLKTIFRAF